MTRQETVGKAEHRSVKHFVSAGRELQAAKERFERQQSCLMRRGKAAAQKALDTLPVQSEVDLCMKIVAVKVPMQSQKGVIDLLLHLSRTTHSGEAYAKGTGPMPGSSWAGQVASRTRSELKRFGNFVVTITFQN